VYIQRKPHRAIEVDFNGISRYRRHRNKVERGFYTHISEQKLKNIIALMHDQKTQQTMGEGGFGKFLDQHGDKKAQEAFKKSGMYGILNEGKTFQGKDDCVINKVGGDCVINKVGNQVIAHYSMWQNATDILICLSVN
jgi:hypothetical protein